VLDNPAIFKSEDVEADLRTGRQSEFRVRDDIIAICENPDGIHFGVRRKSGDEPLVSPQSILDPGIVLNELVTIDEPDWCRIPGFETPQERPHYVLFLLLTQGLSWYRRAPESEENQRSFGE
jgi:hypothetical protein